MTRREIFLQADPRAVNDVTVGLTGHRTEEIFGICKGLQLYARGEMVDTDEDAEIARIRQSGTKFQFTIKQAQVIRTGIKGYLRAALELLNIAESPDRDALVNQWLDVEYGSCSNVNLIANNIITHLDYERF